MRSHLKHTFYFFIGFALIIMSGCVSPPPMPPSSTDTLANQQLQNWQIDGKVGIRVNGDAGSAYIQWEQQGDAFRIKLYGPLGQGTTWITGNTQLITLQQPGKDPISAPTAEELMQTALGWSLPVNDFSHWIKGSPAPDQPTQNSGHNADGQLNRFHQSGWDIEYPRLALQQFWHLPQKIIATNPAAKITLIIKEWTLPDATDK